MKRQEQIVSIFWIGLGVWVLKLSLRLEVGTIHDPGPGFLPSVGAVALGLLGMANFVNVTFLANDKVRVLWGNVRWQNTLLIIIALFAYAFLLERLGYIIDTLLLMVLVPWLISRRKWRYIAVNAALTIGVSYLIFVVLLHLEFPKGIWGIG